MRTIETGAVEYRTKGKNRYLGYFILKVNGIAIDRVTGMRFFPTMGEAEKDATTLYARYAG